MDLPPDSDRLWHEREDWPFAAPVEPGTTTLLLVSAAVCLALLVLALWAPATPLLDSGVPLGP